MALGMTSGNNYNPKVKIKKKKKKRKKKLGYLVNTGGCVLLLQKCHSLFVLEIRITSSNVSEDNLRAIFLHKIDQTCYSTN